MSTKNYKRTVVVNGVTYPKVVEEAVFDKYTKQKLSDKLSNLNKRLVLLEDDWSELKSGNYASHSQSEVASIIVNQFGNISDPAGMIYNKDAKEISDSVLNQLFNESKFVIGGTGTLYGSNRFTYVDITEHFRDKSYVLIEELDLVTPNPFIISCVNKLVTSGGSNIRNIGFYVKIPEFYYRTIQVTSTTATYEDCWLIQFSKTAIDDGQGTWQHWNNNSFVATFLATHNNDYPERGALSQPFNDNSDDFSYDSWTSFLSQFGNGLRMINYTEIKALQYLFYAWYGNTDSQALLGAGIEDFETSPIKWGCALIGGSSSYRTTPVLHSGTNKGFSDNNFTQGSSATLYGNSFWGIHNLFGVQYQFINGLTCVQDGDDENVYALIDTQTGSSQRIVYKNTDFEGGSIGGWISKLKFGNYADNYPIEVNGHDGTDYYADYGYVGFVAGYVSYFGGSYAYSGSGIGCVYFADDEADGSDPYFGTRLLYSGSAQELNV